MGRIMEAFWHGAGQQGADKMRGRQVSMKFAVNQEFSEQMFICAKQVNLLPWRGVKEAFTAEEAAFICFFQDLSTAGAKAFLQGGKSLCAVRAKGQGVSGRTGYSAHAAALFP